jgi:hypothetical protein
MHQNVSTGNKPKHQKTSNRNKSHFVPDRRILVLRFVPGRHHLLLTFVPGRHCLVQRFVPGRHILVQTITRNFGPSGVSTLPLAAGRNEGGHYFRYFSSCSLAAVIQNTRMGCRRVPKFCLGSYLI